MQFIKITSLAKEKTKKEAPSPDSASFKKELNIPI